MSEAPWSPSAAAIWASLALLACENDLHVVAADRSGQFALGLVPQHVSAISHADHGAAGAAAQADATDFFGSASDVEKA